MGTCSGSEACREYGSQNERVLFPIDGLRFAGEAEELWLRFRLLANGPVRQSHRMVFEVWVGTLLPLGLSIPASLLNCIGVLEVCTWWQSPEVESLASQWLIIEVTL